MFRNLGILGAAFFAASGWAGVTGNSDLINLPKGASLTFKNDFVVKSMASRSGTGEQAALSTIRIDLLGKTPEAIASRDNNPKVMAELKKLKYFGSMTTMFCYIDFKAKVYDNYTMKKGTVLNFAKPEEYGSPTKYLKQGNFIALDNYATKSISASFEGGQARRFYCSFNTEFKEWYNLNFWDDAKISLLEALVESAFTLKY